MVNGGAESRKGEERLDGDDLKAMLSAAARLLEQNVQAINALNVYPVPDGDTGTNMFLTLKAVNEEAAPLHSAPASAVAAAMAKGAIMGAKGNSGVILSQFFKGLSTGLSGSVNFGPRELAAALNQARAYSYKAVGKPVEGTILTVITSAAAAANDGLDGKRTVLGVVASAVDAANDAVARTPSMLEVLRKAGVVDAGGQGLAIILEGMRRHLAGEALVTPDAVAAHFRQGSPAGRVSNAFLQDADDEMYGYCTQFIIKGAGLDVDAVRALMAETARSAVVVGDDTMVKVHVHAEDPGKVLSAGVRYGTLAQVKIENMDEQHVEFAAARRQEATASDISVIAVAAGEGMAAVLTDLGVATIIQGGDTMNPSVREILLAIEQAPGGSVVVLPNNGNIIPAARQAAELASKPAKVIPTRSIPQAVAALFAFNPDSGLDGNLKEMESAIEGIRTGEVTTAIRDIELDGVTVRAGALIGLLDRQVVAAGDSLPGLVRALLEKADASAGSLVTLYRGAPVSEEDAEATLKSIGEAFVGVECELVYGGQPHYHFIISIE
ncbi:MAG: DAK2 domain-containing protein [SAR202 cluster bacterium]|nr:DAK2 domain-containing protein [SAR202 cluster bacterium]